MQNITKLLYFAQLSLLAVSVLADALPKSILEKLPEGYQVMVAKSGELDNDKLADYLVVLRSINEQNTTVQANLTLKRPLLLFTQSKDGTYLLAKRNDHVVLTMGDGGQCDPFDEGGDGLVIKSHYFTVQNGVACGAHWTDYITFRYSPEQNDWVFHKRVRESWVMNNSNDPNAEALVLEGRKVDSGNKAKPVLFEKYRLE